MFALFKSSVFSINAFSGQIIFLVGYPFDNTLQKALQCIRKRKIIQYQSEMKSPGFSCQSLAIVGHITINDFISAGELCCMSSSLHSYIFAIHSFSVTLKLQHNLQYSFLVVV